MTTNGRIVALLIACGLALTITVVFIYSTKAMGQQKLGATEGKEYDD